MRIYGKIETGFWQNPKVRGLSDKAKTLLLYVYACPHGNSLGCFVLPDGYIMADLSWDTKLVSQHVSELVSKGFFERDEATNLLRIKGWFKHNTIENHNVAKAAIKCFNGLPDCKIKFNLFNELKQLSNKFLNLLLSELKNEFANPEPEPEPEPNLPLKDKSSRGVGTRFALASPPDDWIAFCQKERPDLNPQAVFEKFSDYWKAKAGKDAVKLDWLATWRNWLRNEQIPKHQNQPKPPKTPHPNRIVL